MIHRNNTPSWVFEENVPALGELSEHERRLAFQVVRLQPDLSEAVERSLFRQILKTMDASRFGSTFTPCSKDAWGSDASTIVGKPGETKPFIIDGDRFYSHRNFTYEVVVAQEVRRRKRVAAKVPADDVVDAALERVVSAPPILENGAEIILNAEQVDALRVALIRSLSIVSGGPGTGKTSIIVSLLRLFVGLGVPVHAIKLAAPTGKAASRMNESIRDQLERIPELSRVDRLLLETLSPAETVHRLLGYSVKTGRFRNNEDHQIAAQVIVIDEASMIDLALMAKLFRATPEDTQLILVGDSQQLPSVDAGAVLRDLVPESSTNTDDVAFLKTSFRMNRDDPSGQSILERADEVNRGDVDAFLKNVTTAFAFEHGGVSLHPIDADVVQPLGDFAEMWFEQRFLSSHVRNLAGRVYDIDRGEFSDEDTRRIEDLLAFYNEGRVLCATRVWRTGSGALNDLFHRRMVRSTTLEGEPRFVAGEPIIMLKNDYDRSLFNGDHGVVLLVRTEEDRAKPPSPVAVFRRGQGFRAHHLSTLGPRLSLAYAMTVHKSQGSEFEDVVMVMPHVDIPLLTRELLYTAITRAKRSVTILGSSDVVAGTIRRQTVRHSALRERIDR